MSIAWKQRSWCRDMLRRADRALVWIPVMLIACYRVTVRPLLIGSCKFCPTCSEYAIEAFQRHGLLRGLILTVRRLCRCHPFSPGGIDPVPDSVAPPHPRHGGGRTPAEN